MVLKLMYITNNPEVARIAENAGVDRIFVDMEYIGKAARQGGMDTVQSHHTYEDIQNIRSAVSKAEVLVRCNPIHNASEIYESSEAEIEQIICAGADVVMLPYFKTAEEVRRFIRIVDGRAKTMLLIETPEAVEHIDEILEIEGIDECHIGLNDLSLGYGKQFMFELLADGTVEYLCGKLKKKGLLYGFGGIASLGKGALPAEHIIAEHYRLGSTCAILSRSFCNTQIITDMDEVDKVFKQGLKEIRAFEASCLIKSEMFFSNNYKIVLEKIKGIVGVTS